MNLFELFVKIGVDDQASKKAEDLSKKLGKGLKTAAKVGTAAVTAASGAIVGLTKQSVESYAEYEQLVGGVQTLFGKTKLTFEEFSEEMKKKGVTDVLEIGSAYNKTFEDVRTVVRNADEAYKTAGMSANEYMSTVTSFSASLLQSLGGDTAKAAEYADMAVRDMSDNANKMGTDIEMIQNAYQGFAKQNYTMLKGYLAA